MGLLTLDRVKFTSNYSKLGPKNPYVKLSSSGTVRLVLKSTYSDSNGYAKLMRKLRGDTYLLVRV